MKEYIDIHSFKRVDKHIQPAAYDFTWITVFRYIQERIIAVVAHDVAAVIEVQVFWCNILCRRNIDRCDGLFFFLLVFVVIAVVDVFVMNFKRNFFISVPVQKKIEDASHIVVV